MVAQATARESLTKKSAGQTDPAWQQSLLFHRFEEVTAYDCNVAISSCVQASSWSSALVLFHRFQKHRLQPDTVTLNSVLGAKRRWHQALTFLACFSILSLERSILSYGAALRCISRAAEWRQAALLLSYLDKTSLRKNMISLNQVVSACSSQWLRALAVFGDAFPQGLRLNPVSCTTMATCLPPREWHRPLLFLGQAMMKHLRVSGISVNAAVNSIDRRSWQGGLLFLAQQWHGVFIDAPALTTALSIRSKASAWQAAVQHFWAVQEIMQCATASWNAAMSSYEQGSSWQQTLVLFTELCAKQREDAVSFAAAMSACATGVQWEAALSLLTLFRTAAGVRGFDPSNLPVLHATAVSACGQCEHWEMALCLLDSLKRIRLDVHVPACNAAISACERAARWQAGLCILSELQHGRLADVISYNTAISACSKAGHWQLGMGLFSDLARVHLPPDVTTLNTLLSACADAALWKLAVHFFQLFQANSLQNDVIAHTAAISAQGRISRWQGATDGLTGMATEKIELDIVSCSNVISAAHRGGQWLQAVLLRDFLCRRCLRLDVTSVNSAISACGSVAKWREALDLSGHLPICHLRQDSVSCNASLGACCQAGDWMLMLSLLRHMTLFGVRVSSLGLLSAMAACATTALWEEVLSLLSQACAFRDAPVGLALYNSASVACGNAAAWQHALAILQQLPAVGYQADAIGYSATLLAVEGTSSGSVPGLLQEMAERRGSPEVRQQQCAASLDFRRMLPAAPPRAAPTTAVVGHPSSAAPVRPGILRNTWKVANEVIWPCSYALCTAPVRAAALLGTALGLRRNRRRASRRISGSVSCHRKPQWQAPNPMAHFAQELRRGAAEMGDRLRQLFGGIHVPSLALPAAAQAIPAHEEVASVQPGAIYQNDYMTLWNDSNDPVSAVLRVVAPDRFELKVSQLDSVGGGSDGWITFRAPIRWGRLSEAKRMYSEEGEIPVLICRDAFQPSHRRQAKEYLNQASSLLHIDHLMMHCLSWKEKDLPSIDGILEMPARLVDFRSNMPVELLKPVALQTVFLLHDKLYTVCHEASLMDILHSKT
ncbi:unnamed protein product [Symbiodinium sp. CCMP2592]|nr:unnamed protein product [Symbiodinium sp. CCMP2592]